MKYASFVSVALLLASTNLMTARSSFAGDATKIDLTKWSAPDITSVGNDPFGQLVKWQHAAGDRHGE